ncbi:chitin synthase-domain-containing protein [Polychytrium aggregatum]|uniref:chitin synthase-domain-containing protein n=1 Tax=Polychytrium aggregatum TaxID=110093 RepID=UPI0022FECB84|nr:chitin synthase-domain-containing protein [Polychytrium aggregatum]KAI9208382.1 chitin synthase-domain-containing protein [Polychytrium aggregatum]
MTSASKLVPTLALLALLAVSANAQGQNVSTTINTFSDSVNAGIWDLPVWVRYVQGALTLVAFLDFAIFTGCFLYGMCLAGIASKGFFNKTMPFLSSILFLVLRFCYFPFLYVLIPVAGLPKFPMWVNQLVFVGLVFMYITLLIAPVTFGIIYAVKYRSWANAKRGDPSVLENARQKVDQLKQVPKMVVVMPIYNEEPDALITAVNSIVTCEYPCAQITVFLSFDSSEESELFLALMKVLTHGGERPEGGYGAQVRLIYRGVYFIVNRFPHGGKRHVQALTFDQIRYDPYFQKDETLILFIDSDIVLYEDAMVEFATALDKNPKLVGMTGFISVLAKKPKFWWWFQDVEYVTGQVFNRALESGLGGVTCLPGALTMIRLKQLTVAAETYFSELDTKNIFNYHRYYLGEDRYLTHLLMEQEKSYAIGFCPTARAKTEAPATWKQFLKQRRRWLLGAFANEVYFLSSAKLWARAPLLLTYVTANFSCRSTGFFFFIILFQMAAGSKFDPTVMYMIWVPLLFFWILVSIFAIILKRSKVALMYPLMLILNPWVNFFINIYSIRTWNLRSWGGPRTDVASPVVDVCIVTDLVPDPETQTLRDYEVEDPALGKKVVVQKKNDTADGAFSESAKADTKTDLDEIVVIRERDDDASTLNGDATRRNSIASEPESSAPTMAPSSSVSPFFTPEPRSDAQ